MTVQFDSKFLELLKTYQTQTQIQPTYTNTNNINSSIRMFDEPEDRTQEPISSYDDINNIISYYLNKGKYRNALLFVCGINFGIRVSDLRTLKLKQFINSETGTIKDYFFINEEKTGKKNRIWINQSVKEMLTIFLVKEAQKGKIKDLEDYLFTSESNNKQYEKITQVLNNGIKIEKEIQSAIIYEAIVPIIKDACKKLNIKGKHNTHSLRKTFAWGVSQYYLEHQGVDREANTKSLMFLQRRFKHSSTLITEHYLGITDEEDKQVCMNLNLGLDTILKWKRTMM